MKAYGYCRELARLESDSSGLGRIWTVRRERYEKPARFPRPNKLGGDHAREQLEQIPLS